MRDADKTKNRLIEELSKARHRIAELETALGCTNATWCSLQSVGIPEDLEKREGSLAQEQRQTREPLPASAERYASILRKAPTGIGVSVHRIIEGVNEVVCNMTGYTRAELVGKSGRVLYPTDEDYDLAGERYPQIADHGIGTVETRWRRKDGTVIDVLLSSAPVDPHDLSKGVTFTAVDITERKKAEEVADTSRALMSAILDSTDALVWCVDPETFGLLTWNLTFHEYFRLERQIVVETDMGPEDLAPAGSPSAEMWRSFYRRVLTEGPFTTEYTVHAGTRILEVSFNLIRRKGRVFGISVFGKDITKIWRAEKELRESEERFRILVEPAPEAIFVQTDGVLVYANPAMIKLLGATEPEEILGKEVFTWVTPEHHESVRARMSAQSKTGAFPPIDREYIRIDGSRVSVETTAVGIKFKNVDSHLVFVRDVTERKRAEEALRQSEEMYRTLIAACPDAIIVTDLAGRVTLASSKAVELFGVSSEARAVGRSVLEWMIPEDRIEVFAAMEQLLSGEGAPSRELILKKDDGTLFDAEVHAAPIRLSDGMTRGMILITRDVTERKNLQAQLLQSQKMEAIGTLAGGIAHDFNNILTTIMGYAGLMETKLPEDHPFRSFVQQINSCTSKAANVTRSLLTFSRKQAMELSPQSMNTIIRDIQKLLRRIVPEDVELTFTLNEDAAIMADMTQIDQVLINLVSNARDAMQKEGKLQIETGVVQLGKEFKHANGFGKPGRYGCISVIDNGAGIDEAIQKKIFEPFFTTKDVGKGTGLGLSIVYGIVKQHGGYITVSSKPGSGTRFDIYLPEIKAEITERRQPVIPRAGGTETLLLAEDNPDVRRTVKEMLCASGYTVIEAHNGEDAVRKYGDNKNKVDLLILDVVMPVKNGREAYEEIRQIGGSVRALFMSGYTGDVVLDRGVQDGTFDYIPKPLSASDLLQKIREILDR
ncbi:MAG TPA: hypothetical protein DCR97_05300 [Deltaproteobacteria bacterium]|nr:hypothetical protein [Deltaproteobacteria bacterium]